jgi:hypothetical protein
VITGFNTDVEYQGVTYHVQTEDKGLETPLILSLVYSGGAILASKRAPYDDLIAAGFNEQTLAERLQRQHKLICAAINAGRLDDLKRMSGRATGGSTAQLSPERPAQTVTEPAEASGQAGPVAEQAAADTAAEHLLTPAPTPSAAQPPAQPPQPTVHVPAPPPQAEPPPDKAEAAQAEAAQAFLHLSLLEERELRGGEFVTLRVRLSRGTDEARDAVPDATITLKILGTTFRPVISSARTDQDGIAIVFAALPRFNTGRAAILIRANAGGEEAEMRRIVHPS